MATSWTEISPKALVWDSLKIYFLLSKLIPSESNESGGNKICFTKTSITWLNDATIIIPIAMPIIFPFTANSLNSCNNFIVDWISFKDNKYVNLLNPNKLIDLVLLLI